MRNSREKERERVCGTVGTENAELVLVIAVLAWEGNRPHKKNIKKNS